MAKEREASNREGEGKKGFKRLEGPKFEVTNYLAEKNLSDCWAKAGEKGERDQKDTCKLQVSLFFGFQTIKILNFEL